MRDDRIDARKEASRLTEPVEEAANLARKLGLGPYPVNYWIVDHDEMNELIAYGGFQRRYPHWRWGMAYDRQRKQDQFGMGKAFEIVNNDNPAHAFLQESNSPADQKAVITHVEAHADFFANNEWFGLFGDGQGDDQSELDAAAMLERHAETIKGYVEDPEIDRDDVERFIDAVLCLEDTIDQHRAFARAGERRERDAPADLRERLDELDVSEDVRRQAFDDEWLDDLAESEQARARLENPHADVLAFLLEHGRQYDEESGKAVEFEPWQKDVLDILRTEAYYFAGQKMTKVMNEGWACVDPETPIFTEAGLIPMREVVEDRTAVSDGSDRRSVYDTNVIPDHDTVTIETRRGFELTGSDNHRIRCPDGSWVELGDLAPGDEIEISGGSGVWPNQYADIDWDSPECVTLDDVADAAGVSVWTVMRYRRLGRAEQSDAIERALERYDGAPRSEAASDPIRVPDEVTEDIGRFLGLLVGDGHVSTASNQVGFTADTKPKVDEFAGLAEELFGVSTTVSEDGSRWRCYVYSANLVRLLTDAFDATAGAADKAVPTKIRRSPKSVVAAFLQGLFDADGYAGDHGVILSRKSESVSETVQLLLTNFGILSRRREQTDGCYHVHLTGASAKRFDEEIGYSYPSKDVALRTYLDDLEWFETERWTDEIVDVSTSTGDVFDISVEETHRYAGAGFVNHNSYWESTMMSDEGFAEDDEFVTYADHMARVLGSPGLNPYKLGMELWQYVENVTNRREVVDHLLRVEGVTWRNFHDVIDFEAVADLLAPDPTIATITPETLDALDPADPRVDAAALDRALDGEIDVTRYPWKVLTTAGLAERHFSLCKPQNRGFLRRIRRSEVERLSRYMFDDAKYDSVADALADVDYTAGWTRMRELRESHNDVTFIDAFLSEEFVTENDYFTYEFSQATGDFRVASEDPEDIKKKLLLQFTNFGKPTVAVYDGNFDNRNELLLGHQYNGIDLDVEQAKRVLERTYDLWGRPVNLMTIVKEYDEHELEIARRRNREPTPSEVGKRIRYDGEQFGIHDLDPDLEERIAAADIDYDTKPADWLN
ncbi:SpoVR family protein [Haloplanus pelagicus]|uniref:SpoVR family protein n=1 Tax=Haloplanus pelagicus TaxID=2949995 RepID=UPI00203BC9A4|nr:SpoVR family protein [Haloplanus sp. HW8-1]